MSPKSCIFIIISHNLNFKLDIFCKVKNFDDASIISAKANNLGKFIHFKELCLMNLNQTRFYYIRNEEDIEFHVKFLEIPFTV